MKTKMKLASSAVFAAAVLTMLAMLPHQLSAQTAAGHQSKSSSAALWSVQVDKVDPGDVSLEPAFRIAIYENLLQELSKTKQFKQVFRSGERDANGVSDLLILKTAVQKYSPGSETRRAVTTVSGATKLNVRSQLCKPDGTVVVDLVVDGNVRFLGGNLRATHNLAHNVAYKLKDSKLPDVAGVGKS
jgi:hypothetical protein